MHIKVPIAIKIFTIVFQWQDISCLSLLKLTYTEIGLSYVYLYYVLSDGPHFNHLMRLTHMTFLSENSKQKRTKTICGLHFRQTKS